MLTALDTRKKHGFFFENPDELVQRKILEAGQDSILTPEYHEKEQSIKPDDMSRDRDSECELDQASGKLTSMKF